MSCSVSMTSMLLLLAFNGWICVENLILLLEKPPGFGSSYSKEFLDICVSKKYANPWKMIKGIW